MIIYIVHLQLSLNEKVQPCHDHMSPYLLLFHQPFISDYHMPLVLSIGMPLYMMGCSLQRCFHHLHGHCHLVDDCWQNSHPFKKCGEANFICKSIPYHLQDHVFLYHLQIEDCDDEATYKKYVESCIWALTTIVSNVTLWTY